VTRDVKPYAIVGGNPAKVIRKRFSERQIQRLLQIQWWHWDIGKITDNLQDLTSVEVGQ